MNRARREVLGVDQEVILDEHCAGATADWVGDAVPEQIARLRAAVGGFASHLGAPDALVEDVRLAVTEALTNAVLHAYPNDARGRVEARATADPAAGLITIRVRDYGTGYRPRADSPGIGMGLPIMAAISHTMEIETPADGGTEVRVTFALAPTGSAALAS